MGVGLTVGLLALGGLRSRSGKERQDVTPESSGGSAETDKVTALGRIQPFDGIVTIGVPLPDRILAFEKEVEVGKEVKEGQPLVKLESARERQLELALVNQLLEDAKGFLMGKIDPAALKLWRELIQERYDRATIRAPQNGTILLILAHRGEIVGGQAAILQMADTGRMAVIAEVYETDIHRVYEGQKAEISVRAYGGLTLHGKVVRIASIVGRNQVLDIDPRAAVDRRVIDVKIELDDPGPAHRLINHQVQVKLLRARQSSP